MGLVLLLVIWLITIASTYFFIAKTWWLPAGASAAAAGIDHHFTVSFLLMGTVFVAAQLGLAVASQTRRFLNDAASPEHARFLHLFDELALFCEQWLDKMRPEQIDWAPIENPSMKFGDRVSRITVKGLVIHLIVGEAHWDADKGAFQFGAKASASMACAATLCRFFSMAALCRRKWISHRRNIKTPAASVPMAIQFRIWEKGCT